MNQSKKLELSKETLRCLDDDDLMDVVGGGGKRDGQGHGGGNYNFNSGVCSGICASYQCQSVGICNSVVCNILVL